MILIIFCHDMRVAKNTSRPSKCQRRAAGRKPFWQQNRRSVSYTHLTKEPVTIAAAKIPTFKAGKALKDAIK